MTATGWPDEFHAVSPAACVEACLLLALASHLVLTQQTITAHWRRASTEPLGLLALGAVTGAAIAHLWIDNGRQ